MPTLGKVEVDYDTTVAARRPLQPEECVLAVVDIQEKLLPPIFNKEDLVRNAKILIRLAKLTTCPSLPRLSTHAGSGARS